MVQALNASMRAESTFFQATEYLKAGVGAEEAGRPVQSALMFLMAAGRIANVLANPQETEPIRKQKAALSDKLPAIDQHLVKFLKDDCEPIRQGWCGVFGVETAAVDWAAELERLGLQEACRVVAPAQPAAAQQQGLARTDSRFLARRDDGTQDAAPDPALARLMEMGYDRRACEAALAQAGGEMRQAADLLLTGGVVVPPSEPAGDPPASAVAQRGVMEVTFTEAGPLGMALNLNIVSAIRETAPPLSFLLFPDLCLSRSWHASITESRACWLGPADGHSFWHHERGW